MNPIIKQQEIILASCMNVIDSNQNIQSNQRFTTDKITGVRWLEERRKWKDSNGNKHNCWVRIAVVQ